MPRNLFARPDTVTFRKVMCPVDTQDSVKVAKYCKIVLKTFQEIFRNINVFTAVLMTILFRQTVIIFHTWKVTFTHVELV